MPSDLLISHDALISELTQMDERASSRPGHNPYALPQYFEAAEGVETVADFANAFTATRGMHGVARRLGLALDVVRGEWVEKGTGKCLHTS